MLLKLFGSIGGALGFLSVALGAFGAHSLKEKLSEEMLSIFQKGVYFQMIAAIGLILIGLLSTHLKSLAILSFSGWFFIAGTLLFSGSLYLLSLTQIRIFGAITPFGGVCFLLAWAFLTLACFRGIV